MEFEDKNRNVTPCDDSRTQKEEERYIFFPRKDSTNEKP